MDGQLLSHIAARLVQFLCLAPLALLFLLPLLWRGVGALLGLYLRKKTDGRRCHILEVAEAEEKQYRQNRRTSSRSGEAGDSDGWEKVDAALVGPAKNGARGDDDWDGIVGFFHPFW
jgi:alpha-1,2-mannosyltransferase